MKKPSKLSKKPTTYAIPGVGIGLVLIVLVLSLVTIYQHQQITALQNNLDTKLLYNEIDSLAQANAVVISPQESRVYIPELKLFLPYNNITKTLRYTYGAETGDTRFYSTRVTDHEQRQVSCYDMLRVKAEAMPNAYSPSQPHTATLKLKDGRTMQVYASTNGECQEMAWRQLSPEELARQFKAAQSY